MNYLDYFKEISKIPHTTHHTKNISDYLCRFAQSNNLSFFQDDKNNVIIYKKGINPDTEKSMSVILQSHIDMVGVSIDGRDMSSTPLELKIDGDKISACGTSLGADNGIGISYMLDILGDKNLTCPDIQAVFTVDEEEGMEGIECLDFSKLDAKYVINLDSENDNEVIVSSAGGINEEITILFDKNQYKVCEGDIIQIKISGLTGGHSGCAIQHGRANAMMCLIDVLSKVIRKDAFCFVSLDGGKMRNAIPDFAITKILYAGKDVDALILHLEEELKRIRQKFFTTDPSLEYDLTLMKNSRAACLMQGNARLFELLASLPNGLMETDDNGDNLTSLNFGIADSDITKGKLFMKALVRSNIDSHKVALLQKIQEIIDADKRNNKVEPSAFECIVENSQNYNAWQKKSDSKLLKVFEETYRSVYGKSVKVTSTHGGLECGQFANKIKNCDIISIGPTIENAHSVNEFTYISSCDKMLKVLKKLLNNWEL